MDVNKLWSEYNSKADKNSKRYLEVNTILAAKYLVGPVLGQGGFGIMYIGFDLNMETYVAIKEYFPVELVSRDTSTAYGDRVFSVSGEKKTVYEQGLKKYVEEAQRISRFAGREGVVSIKDFFYENNTAYIVMEYIHGKSLKEYLEDRGSLSEEESLRIMRPVIETLAKIHDAGIIHRDISPDNIMLTLDGGQVKEVKLIDFGSARMTAKNDQKSLTIILKHGYAPEEQYRTHGEQGPWTDVYAVCAVLYRMMTGKTPDPAMDRLFRDDLKRISQTGVRVSKHAEQAIEKGLAVKSENRIPNMYQLAEYLYHGKKMDTNATKRKVLLSVSALGVAAIAAIAILAWLKTNDTKDAQIVNMQADVSQDSETADLENDGKEEALQLQEDASEEITKTLGEVITTYSPQNSIGSGWDHVVLCKPDGTVLAKGSDLYGQCDVADWEHMTAVAAGRRHTLGLREDGVVEAVGDNSQGQCDVSSWKDIVQIAADEYFSFGLTKDGNVLIAGGTNEDLSTFNLQNISNWTDMNAIAYTSEGNNNCMLGIKNDGSVWVEGEVDFEPVSGIIIEDGWQSVQSMMVVDGFLVGIEKDGTVKTAVIIEEDAEYQTSQQANMEQYEQLPKMKQIDKSEYWGVTMEGEYILISESYFEGKEDYYESLPEEIKRYEYYESFYYGLHHAEGDDLNQWKDLVAVQSNNESLAFGIKEDGTILELYLNAQASLDAFEDIVSAEIIHKSLRDQMSIMYVDNSGILAQKKDGSLVAYGNAGNYNGVKMKKQITSMLPVSYNSWLFEDGTISVDADFYPYVNEIPTQNIVKVVEDFFYYVFLLEDGTVQATKKNEEDRAADQREAVKSWCDITDIWVDSNGLCGLKKDGTIVYADDGNTFGKKLETLEPGTKIYPDDSEEAMNENVLAVLPDGTVELIYNDITQLNATGKYEVNTWTDIVDVAFGESHTVGLRADGTVVAAGKNHCGQCEVEDWKDIISIDAYNQFTIGVTKNGELKIAGSMY